MARTFTRKGYGRIYVRNDKDIELVNRIIKAIDEFEHSYLPPDFITNFNEYPKVIYTHKFDSLDLELLSVRCFAAGCPVLCVDAGMNETTDDLLVP